MTHSRIADCLRKRWGKSREISFDALQDGDDFASFSLSELFSRSELEEIWDREGDASLLDAAVDNVNRFISPKPCQVFNLLHFKEWPMSNGVGYNECLTGTRLRDAPSYQQGNRSVVETNQKRR
ncbi:MAG: hypothetical protein M2R45_05062 [Verrucomicrobia subdivision 3 bacterium]|nr:hypothetical protein [Limisphaerales bacterium]MCS1417727.1 hypothetical protein [Limisphaerales bacterium]